MAAAEMTYDEVYEKYSDKVKGYIYPKVTNRADAEDLHSAVFIKVYQKFDTFDQSKASVSTWVYTIARNTVIDYFRARRIHEEVQEDSAISEDNVADELLNQEALEELADALEQLPERERDLVILHYYNGLTLKEVAVKLHMSYSNCKLVHNKALMNLRSLMHID
jgi:RNA polymerase sigma-70 factor (ECF subfamily)